MDKKKTPSAWDYVRLAYAQPGNGYRSRPQQFLPGPLYDVTVFGLFLVLGIAYFL